MHLLPIVLACLAGLQPPQEEALRAIARGEKFEWVAADAEQSRELRAKAEAYLDNFKQYHLPHGLNADVWWADDAKSSVRMYDGLGDSACWTGHYLAALALRYAVAKDETTRADILKALDGFDLLTTISGREGYVTRYAGPKDDAAYEAYYRPYGRGEDPVRKGLGKWAYEGAGGRTNLIWLGNSSRDTYDGTAIGLAAALKYVDDAEVQARARDLARRIGKRLLADGWYIDDGQGHRTRPTITWQLAWMRLLLSADPEQFGHLRKEYEDLFDKLMERKDQLKMRGKQQDEYFPANLDFARFFVFCTLENDPDRLKAYKERVRAAWGQVSDHLNAHFAAMYLLLTGDENDAAKATVQGMLLDFPDPPNRLHAVDSRENEGVEMVDGRMAQHALLARERPGTDFMWQRAPCIAVGGEETNMEFPGIDFFLPYWTARLAGALE